MKYVFKYSTTSNVIWKLDFAWVSCFRCSLSNNLVKVISRPLKSPIFGFDSFTSLKLSSVRRLSQNQVNFQIDW